MKEEGKERRREERRKERKRKRKRKNRLLNTRRKQIIKITKRDENLGFLPIIRALRDGFTNPLVLLTPP